MRGVPRNVVKHKIGLRNLAAELGDKALLWEEVAANRTGSKKIEMMSVIRCKHFFSNIHWPWRIAPFTACPFVPGAFPPQNSHRGSFHSVVCRSVRQ